MGDCERDQEIGLYLARRAYFYSLMHVVFGSEPVEEALAKMLSSQAIDAIDWLARSSIDCGCGAPLSKGAPSVGNGFEEARDVLADAVTHELDPSFCEGVRSAYSRLFLVPGESSVRLWESSYVGKEGMVFQDSTLDVRAFYHDAGFKLQAERRFPDDHIAAMMDYMGRLSARAYEAFADGEDDTVRTTLATQAMFAERHILTWVHAFALRVKEKDPFGIYAAFAEIMAELTQSDCEMAKKLVQELG